MIQPKTLKGFRDLLPKEAKKKFRLLKRIEDSFCLFGFHPIETPSIEYSEVLLGKGSGETDKQLFRWKDQGDRDIALRFDLTVPLARFVAQNQNELNFPLKRFQVANVWRAEKPQRGRFREFTQCDIDIVGGSGKGAEVEVLSCLSHALNSLSLDFCFRINSRKFLSALVADTLGQPQEEITEETSTDFLRALDKLDKLGEETVVKEMSEKNLCSSQQAKTLIEKLQSLKGKSYSDSLEKWSEEPALKPACSELLELGRLLKASGLKADSFRFDPSIARGLDYYTGLVFETELKQCPEIGSIASGGRYDNLLETYTKRGQACVGASIGLDRILSALEGLEQSQSPWVKVLVISADSDSEAYCMEICRGIRAAGVNTSYHSGSGKLSKKLTFAEKSEIPFAIIVGQEEREQKKCTLKSLSSREQNANISIEKALEIIQSA